MSQSGLRSAKHFVGVYVVICVSKKVKISPQELSIRVCGLKSLSFAMFLPLLVIHARRGICVHAGATSSRLNCSNPLAEPTVSNCRVHTAGLLRCKLQFSRPNKPAFTCAHSERAIAHGVYVGNEFPSFFVTQSFRLSAGLHIRDETPSCLQCILSHINIVLDRR